jgi:diphosphomevalonate decarboxylase
VEFRKRASGDEFVLDGEGRDPGSREFREAIGSFLGLVRERGKTDLAVRVETRNDFPTAAGLASSASGYAALALACDAALDLGLSLPELSGLARRGSGSASRSLFGGFAEWRRGEREDGSDSIAESLAPPDHWPEFRMIVCLTARGEKAVKSREGMAHTVDTSPFYPGWLDAVEEDLQRVREGVLTRDFVATAETAEANCLRMHATMLTAKPALIYWTAETVDLLRAVAAWREEGLPVYFTVDAGPQVKLLCLESEVEAILGKLRAVKEERDILVTRPGEGARLTDDHLF